MKFELFDIALLKESFRKATIANDCLTKFLNAYKFDDVYETGDDSIVFSAGGKNQIDIEFFNFNHPLKRTCSVMYWENSKPVILNI